MENAGFKGVLFRTSGVLQGLDGIRKKNNRSDRAAEKHDLRDDGQTGKSAALTSFIPRLSTAIRLILTASPPLCCTPN